MNELCSDDLIISNKMKRHFVSFLVKFFFILFFLLPSFFCFPQNLLLNGDFEEENICSEYHVNCAPEAWLTNDDVFNNYFKDASRAYHGFHCMSIEAGHAKKLYKRTFIRSRFLCGLRKGNQYRLEFYVKSPHRILDSIGVLFSSHDFLFDRRPLQTVTPSFYLADINKPIKKDSSWQQVVFTYTAIGDESFITIANFSKRDITGETGLERENNFFVFIDAVSLMLMNPKESLCDDWQTAMAEIYDQDERHDFLKRKIRAAKAHEPIPFVSQRNNMTRIDTLVLQEVLFESGSAELYDNSYMLLDSFCRQATGRKVDSVVVEGHTDNRGTEEMNNQLSLARVQTVLNYFASRSFVRPNRVFARAWGESRPVADNNTAQGRQRNRRVVVFLYMRE
jgi:outer membrane protein OmpA-like peptidoglycan-associated protein